MLRSVKYGLYGAVIAGVISGTVAWQGIDKTVQLTVDGQTASVHTTASRVADVLHGKGYSVGPHDIVAPAATASVHDGSKIVFARGRLLHLDVNGVRRDIWTTAPTVAQALLQLGYPLGDFTSVSRDRRLPLTPTSLTIRTPQLITVKHDGRVDHIATTDETVGDLLKDLGITLAPKDKVSPAPSTVLITGMTVTISRLLHGKLTAKTVLHYPTQVHHTSSLPAGKTVVVQNGKDGSAQLIYAVVWIDGKLVDKKLVKTIVLTRPVPKIVNVGTAGTTPSAAPVADPVSPGSAQAIAQQMVAARGWDSGQFNCLVQLWDNESGWRVNAANASGAYGIPQALPGSKMGPGWQTDATVQITWGLGYIAGRYGTPCAAWGFWQSNGWY